MLNLVPKAIEVQAKDGAWYLMSIKPYRTLENVIDGAVITFVDISEQKRGDELRRLGTILRDSNDAVTVQDFTGKILAWNRGAVELYGWNEAEALTMNSLEMMPANARAEAITLYQRLSKGENLRSFESQRITRGGKILDIWITLTALVDDAKQPVGVATTERNITDRIQDRQICFFENRGLKALNHWYQTLLDHPESLSPSPAEAACQILVKEAGYRMAWIGKVDQGKRKKVTLVAWAGVDNRESERLLKISQEVVARALSSREPVKGHNRLSEQPGEALKNRDQSFLVLPILSEQSRLGALVIYAPEPDAFAAPEVERLVEFSRRVTQTISSEWQTIERQEK